MLYNSIEGDEDEGIGFFDYDNGGMVGMILVIGLNWNFQNIKFGLVVFDGDIVSDIVQNDNLFNDDGFVVGDEMDEVFMSGLLLEFIEYELIFFEEEILVFFVEVQNLFDQIVEDKWVQQQIYIVFVDIVDDYVSDKVVEIWVGDGGED